MKLWKSVFITSIALTSLNVVATESGQNFNQSAKHSALAGSTGLKGSGQVAVSAATTPVMLVGGLSTNVGSQVGKSAAESGPVGASVAVPAASVAVVGSTATVSAAGIAEKAGAPVPFEIGDIIVIQ
ncbi:hypothetical protein OAG1_37840 [Agarivorans sp. OAG1]|uniref:hypothetical protein n=1 Tax=Agarivorans TaxID=261825 RepID=UPI001C7EB3B0|nr:hypothetical protein [Agarivorans aestuarii]BEU04984.1 hypothetical protein OAG1_37840 [Agarivorans sp. OAG1]